MPGGMFLRSGPDWHLDGAAVHTLAAFLEERGIQPGEADPIPVGVFLDYADWFQRAKKIEVREEFARTLAKANGQFEVTLESGERIRADAVVAAPGYPPLHQRARLGVIAAARTGRAHLQPGAL